jgi:hypothetical protein
MKTILCPVDFTPRSDRLLQYIGKLANERRCKVYLVSTQVSEKREFALAGTHNHGYGRLDKMHDYLSGIQQVPCGIIQESLSGNLYKKLGAIADHYDLMSIAMTSPDEKTKVKDIDIQKIINETLVPILTIPDRFQYHKIKRLLYAYDYKHEPEPPLMQLHWLSDWFEADVLFITLYPGDTSMKEEEKLNSIHHAIKNSWNGQNQINFETIVYPNMPKGLEHYLKLSDENDLLVLSINHQNILERVWHKSVVKGVIQYSNHPYLIIHK